MKKVKQQTDAANATPMLAQANDILAQFSSPILAEIMTEYAQKVSTPQDEDPLVSIRKQELALKGQQLQQDQEQFKIDQQRKEKEARSRSQIDVGKIGSQEDIAEMKNQTTLDRMAQQKEMQLRTLAIKNNS